MRLEKYWIKESCDNEGVEIENGIVVYLKMFFSVKIKLPIY